MQHDLGVGRGVEQRALGGQLLADAHGALVRLPLWASAKPQLSEIGEKRLHVAQHVAAGRRIAVVADGDRAPQAVDDVGRIQVVADEAEAALLVELLAVVGDDAAAFLAAMLQGVQAKRRQRRRLRVAEHAEHAALLVQAIVVGDAQDQRLRREPHRRIGRISRRLEARHLPRI